MSEPLESLLSALAARSPLAGSTRVLAIDGRSGAGKTTLAARLAERGGAALVSMEQLYGGWTGLQDGIERLALEVLEPLAAGRPARVPRYDWHARRWLAGELLDAPPLLIVEGVGAGSLRAAPRVALLAWVELDAVARRERALARDGELYEGHWDEWSAQEEEYLRRDRPRERAEMTIRP